MMSVNVFNIKFAQIQEILSVREHVIIIHKQCKDGRNAANIQCSFPTEILQVSVADNLVCLLSVVTSVVTAINGLTQLSGC